LLTLAFRSAENRRGRARAARGWYEDHAAITSRSRQLCGLCLPRDPRTSARPQAGRRDCPQDPRKSASRFN